MSFTINGYQFNHREGQLHLPKRATEVFASPANPYIGVQVLPPMSPPSKLTLKKYAVRGALAVNRNVQLESVGQIVTIIDEHGINYTHHPYRLLWLVADVTLVTADIIPAAHGYLGNVAFDYAPASRVVTEWTLYPLPMELAE